MTDDEMNVVIYAIAEGRSIRSVCLERGFSRWGFYALLDKNGDFVDQLARAHRIRDEATEEEILDIADEETENHNRQRLRLEARYKILAARRPQRWGAKIDVQVTNKPDARIAEQKADQRLLRYQHQAALPQVIDIIGERLLTLADKQSASAIDNAGADGIFD